MKYNGLSIKKGDLIMDAEEAKVCLESMLIHLIPWAEEHNCEITHKRTTYDPRAGFADITLTVISEDGMPAEEHDLIENAKDEWTDIKSEWVGADVTVRGRIGKFFGYKSRSHKYPYLVKMGNGDVFKVPLSTIVRQLSKETASADNII